MVIVQGRAEQRRAEWTRTRARRTRARRTRAAVQEAVFFLCLFACLSLVLFLSFSLFSFSTLCCLCSLGRPDLPLLCDSNLVANRHLFVCKCNVQGKTKSCCGSRIEREGIVPVACSFSSLLSFPPSFLPPFQLRPTNPSSTSSSSLSEGKRRTRDTARARCPFPCFIGLPSWKPFFGRKKGGDGFLKKHRDTKEWRNLSEPPLLFCLFVPMSTSQYVIALQTCPQTPSQCIDQTGKKRTTS